MAKYAFIENNEITGLYSNLPSNWRNISNFHALEGDTEYLSSLGWKLIEKSSVTYNPDTQIATTNYSLVNGNVVETITVEDLPPLTDEEKLRITSIKHEQAMNILRTKRDKLLAESDRSQLSDVIKINGAELTASYELYRQQLRELPSLYESNINFIDENTVVYPVLGRE